MGVAAGRVEEDIDMSGQITAPTGLRGIIAVESEVRRLNNVTYPSLTKNFAQGLLHHAMAKLKANGARVDYLVDPLLLGCQVH